MLRSSLAKRWASYMVYGANTDIGKTVVGCGLLQAAARNSVKAGYVKPVQTGDETDEQWMKDNGGDCRTVTFFSFKEPASPHIAAALENRTVTDDELLEKVQHDVATNTDDITLIETAGGVLSPAPSTSPQADVYAKLGIKSILIGDPKLGGISSTMCALESLRARGVNPLCVVFVGGSANVDSLEKHIKVICLPELPDRSLPLTDWYKHKDTTTVFDRILRSLLPDEMFDARHIWHPYTSMTRPKRMYKVASCDGCEITLEDGTRLVDGMASWWSAIHGYNVPELTKALHDQIAKMPHVMFGGLTHDPAIKLCRTLVDMTPEGLECVFLCDSGSVSVDAALKMCVQYWAGQGKPQKNKMISLKRGYHGDTWGAMSVCDPVNSMHSLFDGILKKHIFIDSLAELEGALIEHREEVAGVILEPVTQGAGGMVFYNPEELKATGDLCKEYGVLLVADEIATGFGRTGKMFGCDHAGVVPDIMCVGKAMTGGTMTMAAVICTRHVGEKVSGEDGSLPFMHGPTFMGNPLAASVANASLNLLLDSPWEEKVAALEAQLKKELAPASASPHVADVRVLGAIGVIELKHAPSDPEALQHAFVELGVWVRPFGKLVYIMPPYVITPSDLTKVTSSMVDVTSRAY